jgi:uncharacterized protein YndB with AHSA1/START domain
MSKRSTVHATFVIEREYPASRERVFAAWADPDAKARWWGPSSGHSSGGHELDFRVGGSEHLAVVTGEGVRYTFDSRYHDIVEGERIIYSYDMHRDGAPISASVATVELHPAGEGTKLVLTEQGAFLDDLDEPAAREHGTRELLERLESELAGDARAGLAR